MTAFQQRIGVAAVPLLAAVGFLCFANIIQTPLFWDAEPLILDNPLLKGLDIGRIFISPFFPSDDWWSPTGPHAYRPITTLFFWIEHHLWNSWQPGYHLAGITVHILNSCLLFRVAWLLTGGAAVSLLIAAAFLIHPIQAAAVTFVPSLGDLLSGCGTLAILLLHIGWRRGGNRLSNKRLAAETLAYAAVLLSKESAFIAPAVLLAYELPLRRKQPGPGPHPGAGLLKETAGFGLVFLAYVALRFSVLPIGHLESLPFLLRCKEIVHYFLGCLRLLLIIPGDFSFPFFPSTMPVFQLKNILSVLAVGAAAWSWHRFRSGDPASAHGVQFGVLWALFGILPFLNGMFPRFISPNYLYIPLMGLSLSVGIGVRDALARYLRSSRVKAILLCGLTVLGAACAGRTAGLNEHWGNPEKLLHSGIAAGPLYSYPARGALFDYYYRRGDLGNASRVMLEAIQSHPNFSEYYELLGLVAENSGHLPEAKALYEAAFELDPFSVSAREKAAAFRPPSAELVKAIQAYQQAPKSGPVFARACLHLSEIFWKTGRYYTALTLLKALTTAEPGNADAWLAYGDALFSMGSFWNAKQAYTSVIRTAPHRKEGYMRLEELYTAVGKSRSAAETYYRRMALPAAPPRQAG